MTHNSEKYLLQIKSRLAKALEALETPEFKIEQEMFDIKYQEALNSEDETGQRPMIVDCISTEHQHVDDLRFEISDLEIELGHSSF